MKLVFHPVSILLLLIINLTRKKFSSGNIENYSVNNFWKNDNVNKYKLNYKSFII